MSGCRPGPRGHLTQSALPSTSLLTPLAPKICNSAVSGAQNARSLQASHTGPANLSARHCKVEEQGGSKRGKKTLKQNPCKEHIFSPSPAPPTTLLRRWYLGSCGFGWYRVSEGQVPSLSRQPLLEAGLTTGCLERLADRVTGGARKLVKSRCPLLPTGTCIWAGESLQLYYYLFPPQMRCLLLLRRVFVLFYL